MATWIIAIMTICYTIGTFLLWHVTRKNIKQSEEAFKLNVLTTFMFLQKPEYGMPQEEFDSYAKLKKAILPELEKLLEKKFPGLKLPQI
jgi:hypothetical protein